MYPYTWTWTYTFLVIVLLLGAFACAGAVLLLRRSSRHRTPRMEVTSQSISTPQGQIGYRQVNLQVSLDEGLRRAEHTSYFPRIERNATR